MGKLVERTSQVGGISHREVLQTTELWSYHIMSTSSLFRRLSGGIRCSFLSPAREHSSGSTLLFRNGEITPISFEAHDNPKDGNVCRRPFYQT